MTTKFTIPELPDETIRLAERITLADLLDSPVTRADTVSMISNVIRHGGDYSPIKGEDDTLLELDLFRVHQAIDQDTRNELFQHIRDRRANGNR